MTVIYVDILFLINLFLTYFLLCCVKVFLHSAAKSWRILIAACLGGLYAMIIFVRIPPWLLHLSKAGASILMIAVGFGFHRLSRFLKHLFIFYGMNIILAGLLFFLWYYFAPRGMIYQNHVVCFQIPAPVLVLAAVAGYLCVRLVSYWNSKKTLRQERVQLRIVHGDKECHVEGLVDSGNKLVDLMTGLPVIVCSMQVAESLFPAHIVHAIRTQTPELITDPEWIYKFRLIPVQSITGEGLLPGFKPQSIQIVQNKSIFPKEAMLAFSAATSFLHEQSAIIGTSLL